MAGSGCNAYQIRKIYAIGGALGMVKRNEEDDLLHELVESMTGKKSIKALTYSEACKVIGELEGRQGTPPPRKSGKPLRKTAPGHTSEGQRRKVWALMYRLQDGDGAAVFVQPADGARQLAGRSGHGSRAHHSDTYPRADCAGKCGGDGVQLHCAAGGVLYRAHNLRQRRSSQGYERRRIGGGQRSEEGQGR